MSLATLANDIRAKGRGDDTMLVHMTPSEVHGLQSLAMAHGGSLTINPDTGLPEAGILKGLLPTLIGAVLTPLTGGFINPFTAALLVGGVEGIRTGDIGKGIMAGLGAYGGAGLSAGLAGLGAKTAATAAGAAGTLPTATLSATQGIPGAIASSGVKAAAIPGVTGASIGMNPAVNTALSQAGAIAKPTFSAIGHGVQALKNTPWEGIKQVAGTMGPKQIGALGSSVASALTPEQKFTTPEKAKPEYYRTTYNPGTINPRFGEPGQPYFIGQGFGPGTRSSTYQEPQPFVPVQQGIGGLPQTVYAEGGPVPSPTPTFPLSNINQPGYSQPLNFARPTELVQDYEPRLNPQTGDIIRMAGGGLSSLGSYSDGGQLLKGPGDGMSDDIPAMIEGAEPQKAALADGEFVVPADVVSGIGNGSTEAGSRKLYAMMDRVRMARTGQRQQAPEIASDKYLPA